MAHSSLNRGFLTFGGFTLLSRIAGFVRDMLTAAFLGAGPLADAYVVAQRLPNLFRTLFAEGAVNAAFVPAFKQTQHRDGLAAAQGFAEQVQAVLATILLPFTLIMMAAMPFVIRVVAPGFADDPVRYALAVSLGLITFPYLPLITLTALQGGVLNAVGRNGPYAAAPIIFNLVQIAGLLLFARVTQAPAHVLAWGMSVGGLLQFAYLAHACRKAGLTLHWRRPRLSSEVRLFFRRLLPGVIGGSALQLNLVVSTMLASLLPVGAVSYLYYADRLNQLPLGVIGQALYTVVLTQFATHTNEGDTAALRTTTSRAFDLALLLGLPAAGGLAALGGPILTVLFARGAFTVADAQATATVLAAYAFGIPIAMVVRVFAARFQAAGDTATPARCGIVAVAANIAFAVWLLPIFGAAGIALATSLASGVNLLILTTRLRQRQAADGAGAILDPLAQRRGGRVAVATVGMMAAGWGTAWGLAPWLYGAGFAVSAVALAACLLASTAAYTALLGLTGAVDLAGAKALLKRR